ncbi:hypothetical protein N440_1378 [Stenotrophomonas sp. CC22-02]|nr:hypothetical protein N440_1378 [Stenotrophomonas sp. CC22-02]
MRSASNRGLGAWQGCRPAPAEAGETAKAGLLSVGGLGPVAGDAVNPSMGAWSRHPCRSHPCHRTHPAFDSFPRTFRTAWIGSKPAFVESSHARLLLP